MMLAGAPKASQRVYFAPNNQLGNYDVFAAAADDVAAFNITALSTSWGFCETTASASYEAAVRDVIARGVASGATTFSATGDLGSDDCGDGTADVDFPSVNPEVVAVGGTSLVGSLPAPPTSFSEAAWDLSGGGQSTRIDRPTYQNAIVPPLSGTKRLVPDISATADPKHGPAGYLSSAGGWVQLGGTSTAAPLAAAQLAATLSDLGCPGGIGDIHAALYAVNGSHFRDTPAGVSNGAYSSGTGFDLLTGRGSPLWGKFLKSELIGAACPFMIKTSFLQTSGHVTVTVPFSKTLLATGGTAPYIWSVQNPLAAPLPSGLTLNPSTGTVSGTPTTPGDFHFTIRVTDVTTAFVERKYEIVVESLNGRFVPTSPARIFDHTVGTSPVPACGNRGGAERSGDPAVGRRLRAGHPIRPGRRSGDSGVRQGPDDLDSGDRQAE
jgi:kumamolisin